MKYCLLFGLMIIGSSAFCQEAKDSSAIVNRITQHVKVLSSDSLSGRATGSSAEALANNYVKSQFVPTKNCKKAKTIKYDFNYNDTTIHSEMLTYFINNHADRTIMLTAHIDHIGYGGELSLSRKSDEIHNGADDNASGVALVMELQRYFQSKELPFNVYIVYYTGHELGTFGSGYLVRTMKKRLLLSTDLMLNFDMIGRLDNQTKKLFVSSTTDLQAKFTTNTINPSIIDTSRLVTLDTKHFLNRIPNIATCTTGIHTDYHRTSDDWQYINYTGIYLIFDYFKLFLQNYN